MATKKQQKLLEIDASNNGFVGFVNHRLSATDKERFDEWLKEVELTGVWGDLERLVDSHYKLSFKHDDYGGGVQASLTCADTKSSDYGLCLTARAPDFDNAVKLLLFKHFWLLGGEWFLFYQDASKPSQWG